MDIVIARRFRGPPESGNGGYSSGMFAHAAGMARGARVALRTPPPLDHPMFARDGVILDGHTVIAEVTAATPDRGDIPKPVTLDDAMRAREGRIGYADHPFPTCFVCGPESDDGLRIYSLPVDGRDDVVAGVWTPSHSLPRDDGIVRDEIVWASLDCPGGWSGQLSGIADGRPYVLGTITAEVLGSPKIGDPHVLVSWPCELVGRKFHSGTALFTADGRLLAHARQIWIMTA